MGSAALVLRLLAAAASLAATVGCGSPQWREDPSDWWSEGTDYDVMEPVVFTETPYTFPADPDVGVGALLDEVFPVDFWTAAYGSEDQYPAGSLCESYVDDALPFELDAVVTILPDFYFKTSGCTSDDEKYYGSYFVQDATGGILILGDSKVAHFDMGDRIRLSVRGARTSYDLNMVTAHDVIEVVEHDVPIFYEPATGTLGAEHIGRVTRVSGVVTSEPDTFGAFQLEAEDGTTYDVTIDSELTKRGITVEPGQRVEATGPVLFSFDIYAVIVMRVGQLTVLE